MNNDKLYSQAVNSLKSKLAPASNQDLPVKTYQLDRCVTMAVSEKITNLDVKSSRELYTKCQKYFGAHIRLEHDKTGHVAIFALNVHPNLPCNPPLGYAWLLDGARSVNFT